MFGFVKRMGEIVETAIKAWAASVTGMATTIDEVNQLVRQRSGLDGQTPLLPAPEVTEPASNGRGRRSKAEA